MNKSEEICYKWMIEQGYKEEDIFFTPNKSPDFTCNDGSRYEAKKLYGRNILMYATQIESLENAIIVVVDTNKERDIRMSDIPEFHGNPNDLDWNPEYVFKLKSDLEQAKNQIDKLNKVVEAAKKISSTHKTIKGFISGLEITGVEALQEALTELKG